MQRNRMLLAPTLILLTAVLTACGSPINSLKATNESSSGGSSTSEPITIGASTGAGLQSPYSVAIKGTGYDSLSVTVPVGSVLKVAFIAGTQDAEYNGVFYPYSALAVYLGVGTNLQPTQLVHNGYGGTTAEISTVIDLSNAFTSTCQSGNTNCRTQVSVVITQPQDDDACINQTTYNPSACPYSHVPTGHPWNGTLMIQTDDTTAINDGTSESGTGSSGIGSVGDVFKL